ncbi:MAG TPA: TraB/GumN family protein [Archangium sp.]|uniref:TraB/GumN family protein n=1 Tax=Archangium sp. TaxID=1872627 RepID=UPI002E3817ED|nr:TraB/GumN family protein [Archangium sp.]HEX5746267.1 TraB/GumN family protein [Archangium sp.]
MRPNRLLLAFLALLGTACATTSAERPASTSSAVTEQRAFLWEVTRPGAPDKRLYLTGSVHLGRPGQFVFPPSMEAAFARSQALVVELDPDKADPGKTQQLMLSLGTFTHPDALSAHLSPETKALLPEAIQKAGLPAIAVERMRPWLLSLTLSLLEMQRAGYSEEGGIDRMLLTKARGTQRIVELETVEEQMRMLAGMPDSVQDLMLREQLQQSSQTAESLASIATAWQGGNPDALARALFERADDPSMRPFYEALFFTRNRRMADQLAAMLDQPETHFAVVGAGHLVGEEGILALLTRKGFQVRQLPREP